MDTLRGLPWRELLAPAATITLILALPPLYRRYLKPWLIHFYRERMQVQYLCAIIGCAVSYPVLFYKMWAGIDSGASSTAAIGYLFVPFAAAVESLFFGAIGYSIGSAIRAWRTRERRHVLVALAGAALSLVGIGFVVSDAARDRELAEVVAEIADMDDAGLNAFLDSHEHRTDRYALGAVAMNPLASAEVLARIAARDDPGLHERYGGAANLMSGNRKGLAVMRLVARHPHVTPATLELLAASHDPYLLGDVAGNKATPRPVIERLYRQLDSTPDAYLLEWGLAYNVATPAYILLELARASRNQYTLHRIADNPEAPEDVRSLASKRLRDGDYRPY